MDAQWPASDESAATVDGRPRYGRDWLIAAGSLIPVVGVAFPCYLAWRDDRVRWTGPCFVLVVAAVACFPLADAGAAVDEAVILAVWVAAIAAAIVLASTVSPERRRASAADIAAWRHVSQRRRRLGRALMTAGIDPQDPRPRGPTALTAPIVILEGEHRGTYAVIDPDERPLGHVQPAGECPPAFRARYELLAPDGSPVLVLHVAPRSGREADLITSADGTELVRLEPADRDDELLTPHTPRRRPLGRLGFGPRWLISGDERVGAMRRADKRGPGMRIIADARGADVARVVRTSGGAGPSGTQRRFVIALSDAADDRMRAVAVFVGVLWDWYISSWDAEGG
jgi:hypothetical protein